MDRNPAWLYKTLVVVVIVLFIVTNSLIVLGNHLNKNSDISLITIKVNGEIVNNWYVSDVGFTFTNESENIAMIKYAIDDGPYLSYTNPFVISQDGEDIWLQWYAVDYEGNCSDVDGPFLLSIDQTEPALSLTYEVTGGNWWQGWDFEFTAYAVDDMSGMERVEFYFNNELQETVYGAGPEYLWKIKYWPIPRAIWRATAYDNAGHFCHDEILDPCKIVNFETSEMNVEICNKKIKNIYSIGNESSYNIEIENNEVIKNFLSINAGTETFDPGYVIIVLNRNMGENDWIISNATIPIFYESDRIDKVYYQINNGSWIPYTNPVVITNDGAQKFSWYTVDFNGHSSAIDSISFKIDRTKPEISLKREKIFINKFKYTANVYDETSNIDRVEFFDTYYYRNPDYIDYDFPYEWIRDGFLPENVVTAFVYDKAGNGAMDINHRFSRELAYNHPKGYQFPFSSLWFNFLERFPFLRCFYV